jgi:hypothetical protein
MGARERKVYWDHEEDPKHGREYDCRCQCNPASREEEEQQQQIGYNHKEIIEVFLVQEGNFGDIAKASSILNEIGRKNVQIPGEKMTKPLIPLWKK